MKHLFFLATTTTTSVVWIEAFVPFRREIGLSDVKVVSVETVEVGSDGELLECAERFARMDFGEKAPSLLAPNFEFEGASGRSKLTKRRFLQTEFVGSLRRACPGSFALEISDARFADDNFGRERRVLFTTRYSGTHTGEAWAPARALVRVGLEPVAPTGRRWSAGPFSGSATVDRETKLVVAASEGFALDRDDACDAGAEALYRAIAGEPAVPKSIGLRLSELARRRRSPLPLATTTPKPTPPFAERVMFGIVATALEALLAADADQEILFADSFTLVGPSFASASFRSALFRQPWAVGTPAAVGRTFNWRLDPSNPRVVRLDLRRGRRLEALSATVDDDGRVSRLAVGFRLDGAPDLWTEVPATWEAWTATLSSNLVPRAALSPFERTLDGASEMVDALASGTLAPAFEAVSAAYDVSLRPALGAAVQVYNLSRTSLEAANDTFKRVVEALSFDAPRQPKLPRLFGGPPAAVANETLTTKSPPEPLPQRKTTLPSVGGGLLKPPAALFSVGRQSPPNNEPSSEEDNNPVQTPLFSRFVVASASPPSSSPSSSSSSSSSSKAERKPKAERRPNLSPPLKRPPTPSAPAVPPALRKGFAASRAKAEKKKQEDAAKRRLPPRKPPTAN